MTLPAAIAMVLIGIPVGWLTGRMAAESLRGRDDVERPLPTWVPTVTAVVVPLLFLGMGWVIEWNLILPAYLVFVAVTIAVTVTDIHARLIPDSLNLPGTLLATGLLVVGALLDGMGEELWRGLIGGGIYFGFLYMAWMLTGGRSMGGGDVKLSFLLGLFTAFLGWDVYVVGIVTGVLIGGVAGVVLLVAGRKGWREHFAYGPPLVLGSYIAIAFGVDIMAWYVARG